MTDLDEKSREILQVLHRNGRISNTELAARVHLSPSATLRRVQDLERRGAITGYRAQLGREAIGLGFLAYLGVRLGQHTKAAQEQFEAAMSRAPEVVECHNTTGEIEYLLRVECADLKAYKTFHTEHLGAIPQVNAITSYVVMGSPKDERA